MNNLTISVIENQTFLEILEESNEFSKLKIKFYKDLNLCLQDSSIINKLIIVFFSEKNTIIYKEILRRNLPAIFIFKSTDPNFFYEGDFVEKLFIPFKISDFQKKIVTLSARYYFFQSSLISLNGYTLDKNERKIKKHDLELQLTEKEIAFLILFSEHNKPLAIDFVLKKVWNYSSKINTHTAETHIHTLRKKILEKFGDNHFIKNNNKGYYI